MKKSRIYEKEVMCKNVAFISENRNHDKSPCKKCENKMYKRGVLLV